MARLAAYFQEEFHYSPVQYGSKHRKAAYLACDEPRNNLFTNGCLTNGRRLRTLTSSEPTLSPKMATTLALRRRSQAYDMPIMNPGVTSAYVDRSYEGPYVRSLYLNGDAQPDIYETESMCGRSTCDDRMSVRSRRRSIDRSLKRLSYIGPYESLPSLSMCNSRHVENFQKPYATSDYQTRTLSTADGRFMEDASYSNVPYRCDSSHGRWQQWPWASEETYHNPTLFSPPSPLDSGLSSQSITSSPSLDAEPIPIHPGPLHVMRPDRHVCSCPRGFYAGTPGMLSPASRYDSGRSSPGAFSTFSRSNASYRSKNLEKSVYAESEPGCDYEWRNPDQIRYGARGLLAEPHSLDSQSSLPKNSNCEFYANGLSTPPNYDRANSKRGNSRPSSRMRQPDAKYNTPRLVITETSEKHQDLAEKSSQEKEISDKSPEPESSESLNASNSSSVASSSNELDKEEFRKAKKAAAKEIRELEDMYQKCNLNDFDLLDRAERRDLPTAHQTKAEHVVSLKRSKSDTLCEVMNPIYRNPFHRPYRAPPFRRAGIPDTVADDMALRKLSKPVTTSPLSPNDNTVTYMLCSSHFTPPVSAGNDILLSDKPDIEFDDFCYRKHYLGKKTRIVERQPPFGIPLRPPPPQKVFTDYLHALPSNGLQPLCHPRGNPDVIRDDMAFRTLRKDEPERVYVDATQYYKKKR